MIDPMGSGYPDDTMTNTRYTYHLDKVSCVRDVWFAHVTFAYLIVLSAIGCLVTRCLGKYRWMHVYFGRLYIIFMLWCMGTSLLVHNSGLPIAVLISFIWAIGGLSLGWIIIKLHQLQMEKKVAELMNEKIEQLLLETKDPWTLKSKFKGIETKEDIQTETPGIFETLLSESRMEIIQKRSFGERMLSYKAMHGALMFMSFINIFGRIFGSNQSGDFTCHTYPYYKQIDTPKFKGFNQSLTAVQLHDPNYGKLPWAHGLHWWGIELSVGPLLLALAVGSYVAWKGSEHTRRPQKYHHTRKDVACVRIRN
jgi:hypothetical protein